MKRALFDMVAVFPFVSGNVVNRSGYESAILALTVAAGAKAMVKVEHCDTAGGTYEAVEDSRLFVDNPVDKETGEAIIQNESEMEGVANLDIDLIGCKEFVRITATDATIGALALGDPTNAPVGLDLASFSEINIAIAKEEIMAAVDGVISSKLGTSPKGCTVHYDADAHSVGVTLTGSASGVSGTGLMNTLTDLVAAGYTVTLDGTAIANVTDVKATDFYTSIAAMAAGAADVTGQVEVTDENSVSAAYSVVVSYPSEG